ncbi:MAG: gluconate 2-dehydrogenase subunit 3 family protein [Proteobacteria bacterium]|nr:gluconate 2-dehydrogenase subunit 3 family protein [Pseudomonadota bacterium]HQR03468.1 gluconate 2-dehydrogenase subunit 3 family protein [Rhodocyclaceae bacterium]
MTDTDLSRRYWLKAAGISWVAVQWPRPLAALAAERETGPQVLNPAEWGTVEALCARIIPTDQEPGAREAGCVNFIDKALAHEDKAALPNYREGLAMLDQCCLAAHGKSFAALTDATQDAVMHALEAGTLSGWQAQVRAQDLFATLRFHTLAGFLADPKYGGNRGYSGWRVVGFPGPLHHLGGADAAMMQGRKPVPVIWKDSRPDHGDR